MTNMKDYLINKKRLISSIVLVSLSYLALLVVILYNPWFAALRLVFAFLVTVLFSNILSRLVTKGKEL